MVRRQEMLQKYVEKCEETLSTKSDAKEALAKEVRVSTCMFDSVGMCVCVPDSCGADSSELVSCLTSSCVLYHHKIVEWQEEATIILTSGALE